MTTASLPGGAAACLPEVLRAAQNAIDLPEVQEMLRKLAEHKLGIYLPHMHDEQTGELRPLPEELMQVESGLEVSFRPKEAIADRTDRFLPVAWVWRAGAPAASAVCEMAWEDGQGDTEHSVKHKMKQPGGALAASPASLSTADPERLRASGIDSCRPG